ncbi:hypothetical protein [Alistipes shahii]|uniref:hypothetical protein n=1 Tax=Alistipes shahii TaxID=328814 RepID=UPI0032C0C87A
MKNYLLIFAVLLMSGCGNRQSQHTDNIHQIAATNNTSNITHELLTWPDSATQIKYGALIDAIYAKCDSYVKADSLPDFVDQIHLSPDGKYRFYSGDVDTVSQGYNYATYIEFKDLYGNVIKKQWKPNLRSDLTGLVCGVWQFNYCRKDYYVIKYYSRHYMPCWSYSMEIVSFDNNGNPTFHTEFYPADIFEPYNEIYLIQNDKGEVIDEYTSPGYGVIVCLTEDFGEIGYFFDSDSLTVHTIVDTTSVNWKPKLAYKSWKFVLPKHLQ